MTMQIRYFRVDDPTDDASVEEQINHEIEALTNLDRYVNYCRPTFVGGEMYIFIVHTQQRPRRY